MIQTSHHEEEMALGSWCMTPTPTRLESSAGVTCGRGNGQGPPEWLCLTLGAGKWTALVPAVVLAPGPLLPALNHKLLSSASLFWAWCQTPGDTVMIKAQSLSTQSLQSRGDWCQSNTSTSDEFIVNCEMLRMEARSLTKRTQPGLKVRKMYLKSVSWDLVCTKELPGQQIKRKVFVAGRTACAKVLRQGGVWSFLLIPRCHRVKWEWAKF